MPELQFKGKEFVYNHHLTVPFRPLEMQAGKGIGAPRLDGNLVIHGDNLHALKALLPTYAGKVDCIFIDPPYNTGNEGWCYNDNVNSPMIKEWLSANPVGLEDGLRHDKWASMMWPRLKLLHELLAEDGVMFVTIDEHEAQRLECILEEIFGERGNLGRIVAQLNPKGRHLDAFFAKTHEYVLIFAKDVDAANIGGVAKDDRMLAEYGEEDAGGKFRALELRNRNAAFNPQTRPGLYFPLFVDPATGTVSLEQDERHTAEALPLDASDQPTCWTWSPPKIRREGNLLVGRRTRTGKWRVFRKDYLVKDGEAAETKPKTVWMDADLNMDAARKTLAAIMGKDAFDFPKPVPLVQRLIELSANPESTILDSFAGSGTTAHAVLAANARDGGNRRFILVEGEDYADTLTAERVRRVINGYSFKGTQREELLREPLTFSKLKNANALLEQVQRIETLDGPKFNRIKPTVTDGVLIVTGERDVAETAPGLGGEFTYCTLGAPIEMDAILSGEGLPDPAAMAGLLWHTATAQPFDPASMALAPDIGEGVARLGAFAGRTYWLFYRDDLDWLKSGEAALSLSKARAIAASGEGNHLVFAPAKFVSRELLASERLDVDYAPLPFALYRLETA